MGNTRPLRVKVFFIYLDKIDNYWKYDHATFESLFDKKLDINLSIAPFMDNSFSMEKEIENRVVSFLILDFNRCFGIAQTVLHKCDVLLRPNIYHYRWSDVPWLPWLLKGCIEKSGNENI